eukprot:CAMPEP_0181196468 /NCGR_PEP_ID=MMETSP1096-20121128/15483_1 /TAXON_ID=156174 ORGANISM="Chrysochromulina ericina, Strain CCMP281" /NCGR_SAMPLE_ID=MMETSP1096 /ASSEMBLY_ACC=CAM_ASM_000453 /LENGTH=71 /DNA_ID=CAMNT_0023286233 /DNA_START=79 /DNA_END=295 /DNA_ORIENTATION=-
MTREGHWRSALIICVAVILPILVLLIGYTNSFEYTASQATQRNQTLRKRNTVAVNTLGPQAATDQTTNPDA